MTSEQVLVVPIDCHSSRAMFSEHTKREFLQYQNAIGRLYKEKHNKYCLLFERTLKTRGRDHMQTNIVPLTAPQTKLCLEAFIELAEKYGVRFTEVQVNIF